MNSVPAAWLLVALVSTLACGSPTGSTLRSPAEDVLQHEPQEEGRKIDGGSKFSHQSSNAALSGYSNVFSTKKGDEKQTKQKVIVLQNDDPAKGSNRKSQPEKVYINNKAFDVSYVNKNSLPEDHPLLKAVAEKESYNFGELFQGLFEIIQDVLTIMTLTNNHNAAEKSDNGEVIATGGSDRWSLTRNLFLKYLRLIKKADVFAEFRDVIPLTELETALEKGDHGNLVQVVIKSITPGFFSYVCGVLKDIVSPLVYLGNNLGSAELREYIPSGIDLLWPVRYFARRTLGLIGHYFSRRELVNYWEQFRSYSPFAARSLESVFPEEEDDETSMNSLAVNHPSHQEGKSFFETALDNPYLLLAGVGSTVMVSLYAYKATRSDPTEGDRTKRSAQEPTPFYPWNTMTFTDLYKVISAVENNPYVDNLDDDSAAAPAVKPKKTSNKKYSSSQEPKKEKHEWQTQSIHR